MAKKMLGSGDKIVGSMKKSQKQPETHTPNDDNQQMTVYENAMLYSLCLGGGAINAAAEDFGMDFIFYIL